MYFSFFMPAKIPAKKSGSTRSEFCEILSPQTPSISQNFARVPHFCTPPPLPPKTLWRSAERFPALLLQQKLCASHRGASARGERLWIFSRIFDKVSSSGIVKTLQNPTFWLGISKGVGVAKRRPR